MKWLWILIIPVVFIGCDGNNAKPDKKEQHKIIREVLETYPDGKLKKERLTDTETHEYTEIEYSPNGKKILEGKYTPNHKRTGVWRSYFENGKLRSEATFVGGKTDGKITVYRENGSIFYEGYYKQGLKEGIWRIYNDSGKLGAEVKYALDTIVYQKRYFKP